MAPSSNKAESIAARSKWARFGKAAATSSFEDGTTLVTEQVTLNLSTLSDLLQGLSAQDKPAADLKKPTNVTVMCRVCKGDHWTTKCPYKDTIGSLDLLLENAKGPTSTTESASLAGGSIAGDELSKPGKYVPPSMRGKAPSGDSFSARRDDDSSTLRITNLSEDTTDEDLHRLFAPFGPFYRCFLSKDRDSGRCKGFAYVGYRSHSDAERALEVMNGKGFDNLILKVEWSAPRKE
eukprot:Partr_v1_DN24994_c0_g1_i1_m45263 putative Component of the eukaryotic translation initiation factor 3 (eIF-3) complex